METQTKKAQCKTAKPINNTELPTPQQRQTPTNNTEILSPIRRVTTNTPALRNKALIFLLTFEFPIKSIHFCSALQYGHCSEAIGIYLPHLTHFLRKLLRVSCPLEIPSRNRLSLGITFLSNPGFKALAGTIL